MTIETTMWLFLAVFTLHEFEEIIMLDAWTKRNGNKMSGFKGKAVRFFQKKQSRLTTASFSLIVAVEFVVLSGLLLYCVQTASLNLWAAVLFAFQFHIVIHLIQFLVLKQYIPAIITSFLCTIYFAISVQQIYKKIDLTHVILTSLFIFFAMAVHLVVGYRYASKFQDWLNNYQCR